MTAIGEVDEANAAIGAAIAALTPGKLTNKLGAIQNELFDLGADLATPETVEGALRIVERQVVRLEEEIDAMNEALAPLTSFILPGGSAVISFTRRLRRSPRERAGRAQEAEPAPSPRPKPLSDHVCFGKAFRAKRGTSSPGGKATLKVFSRNVSSRRRLRWLGPGQGSVLRTARQPPAARSPRPW
jgi:cob(I)alamin adenosyltransferase